ncbi:hypothetical protein V8F06_001723 [Rhypophila decipiens]
MNGPTKLSEEPSIPPLKERRPSQVSNYSYPRPESPFFFIPQYEVRRGSTGSDDSMPGMIEDQGSDVSTEDDYQSQAIPVGGTDLWDSFWQARVHEELGGGRQYPALLETTQVPLTSQEGQRDRAGSQLSQRDSTWPLPLTTSSPNKRQTSSKAPPPRASYSLFPSKHDGPPTTPPRRSSLPKESIENETDSQPPTSPTKPKKVSMAAKTIRLVDAAPTPRPAPRRPLPATPRPQGRARTTTILTASTLHTKPLPKTPDEKRASVRRVSGATQSQQHKRSISKTPTQSLPLLSSSTIQRKTATPPYKHQYSQSQTFHVNRPVPAAAAPPQNVSVFEFSDDEDDEHVPNNRGLARRLVRGLTQHRDRNGMTKAQAQVQARLNHQRSVSDGLSTTTTTSSSSTSNLLIKTGGSSRPQQRERAVTTGTAGLLGAAAMRPSTSAGVLGAGSEGRQSNVKEGGRSSFRPWLLSRSRQGSEPFFGRFLGRRGSST